MRGMEIVMRDIPILTFENFKRAVSEAALEAQLEDYELYYQKSEQYQLEVYEKKIHSYNSSNIEGVSLRCTKNGHTGSAFTEALTEASARDLVLHALENAEVAPQKDTDYTPKNLIYQPTPKASYLLPDLEQVKKDVLDGQNHLYELDARVTKGTSNYAEAVTKKTQLSNSRGLDLQRCHTIYYYACLPVVTDGTEIVHESSYLVNPGSDLERRKHEEETAQNAIRRLGGEPVATGEYPTIFAPEAMTSLLKKYSPIFSSEYTQKGLSLLKGKEESQIASSCVTLIDDPFYPDSPVPCTFDSEGIPTYTKKVIEEGILKTLLYNQQTAKNEKEKQSTGNASRKNYREPLSIMPYSFYFSPGKDSEEKLIKGISKGLYITKLSGLHAGADSTTGDFSLQASGFLIEGGNLTKPISSFTIAGNFFELLENIENIANNLKMDIPVGTTVFGSPSVLVSSLSAAGK